MHNLLLQILYYAYVSLLEHISIVYNHFRIHILSINQEWLLDNHICIIRVIVQMKLVKRSQFIV